MPITRDSSSTSVEVESANNGAAGMANKSGRPGSGFSLSVLGEWMMSTITFNNVVGLEFCFTTLCNYYQ